MFQKSPRLTMWRALSSRLGGDSSAGSSSEPRDNPPTLREIAAVSAFVDLGDHLNEIEQRIKAATLPAAHTTSGTTR